MTSLPSSSSRNWLFDVFPSFRGEDIRQSFLSHFLKELDAKLISVFKDNKIEKSQSLDPVLKQAIKDSRIAIVIFSENYASSGWCLNELLEVTKTKEESNILVIPVFYGIDPSHVRKQTGYFGKIFTETCHNLNKTEFEIGLWQKALTDVANLVGFHSQNWENEANFIEDIVNDILYKLNLTPSMDVKDFVGIEDHIAKISLLLDLKSKEVRMVGIWGTSGIGKTTIARALYSRLSHLFQGRIFIDRAFISKNLEDYRGANTDDYNMKLNMQRNFLSEILGTRHIKVDHLGVVGGRLNNQKVLIFIDDLEDQVVLEALANQSQWFGCGSRIVVITKDKHHLRVHGINHIYKVGLPSEELALEMFCRYAFRQNSPPKDFEKLVVEFARHAGSLPLGLNVLGSSLRGRDKEYWMGMYSRLQNSLDGKIEKTLRLSYDGIDSEEDKALFRLISCLFKCAEANSIKFLLADSDLSINIGLENLVDKSLIHVRQGYVQMHCLLQKMGRKIVREQSTDEPGQREFVLDSEDICHLFNKNTGTKRVLGISLNIDEIDELYVHKNAFKGMPNLRFLELYTSGNEVRLQLDKSFDFLPPKLKLLRWDKCPMKCLPSRFCLENLVILKMQDSKLERLWEGDSPLTRLKEMDLEGSKCLKEIPDLSRATNIRTLYLNGCSTLGELPFSIRNLDKLLRLDMSECTSLETLPTGINLKSLGCLNLRGCSKLRSFPDISKNVFNLNLSHTSIEEIPWWVKNFYRLECLFMENCNKLKYVCISTLKYLRVVDFSNCGALILAGSNGYPSGMEMKADNMDTELPVPEEERAKTFLPLVEFRLTNCFNLDIDALLQQPLVFKQLIVSREEVPLYFTHKATGTSSSLTIPLLPTSLSQPFFNFRACAVIGFDDLPPYGVSRIYIKIKCRFKDAVGNHFDSPDHHEEIRASENGSHLFVFDYWYSRKEDNVDPLARSNYDHVELWFHYPDYRPPCELKEWGIRILEDYSSAKNRFSVPNTLLYVCEANEDNMVDEIEYKNSSILNFFKDEVIERNRDNDTEAERYKMRKRIKTV